jgi:hypothetical protein
MNKLAVITLFFLHVVYFEGAPHISSGGHDLRKEQAIAFPGAEGFWKFSNGLWGGKVYIVSTPGLIGWLAAYPASLLYERGSVHQQPGNAAGRKRPLM